MNKKTIYTILLIIAIAVVAGYIQGSDNYIR